MKPVLFSLQHGADPSKKNRDGNMPLDMVKDGDTDIQDLLRGDAALLDAAKKGCLARVQKLCSPENINCRDTQGRNSTPLHLAGNQDYLQREDFSPDGSSTFMYLMLVWFCPRMFCVMFVRLLAEVLCRLVFFSCRVAEPLLAEAEQDRVSIFIQFLDLNLR